MVDVSEVVMITEKVALLKDKKSLSNSDVNKLMLICGRLTGSLRVCSHDPHTLEFTQKVDELVLNNNDIGKLFYFIAVAVELLGKQYSGITRSARKRYRSHKKKHFHKEFEEEESKDEEEESKDEEEESKDEDEESKDEEPKVETDEKISTRLD